MKGLFWFCVGYIVVALWAMSRERVKGFEDDDK